MIVELIFNIRSLVNETCNGQSTQNNGYCFQVRLSDEQMTALLGSMV
jgi:hypothetical protein